MLNSLKNYLLKFIKKCERCYNICDGGLGIPGVFQSLEWKNKKRIMPRGEKSHMFGRHLSPETRQKIRENHTGPLNNRYGVKLTNEHKQILRDANKKSVLQFDKDNNFIKRWDCIIDAVRSLNFTTSSYIVQCCKGKAKTAYGFIWKYENE